MRTPPNTLCFVELQDTLSRCKYAPFLCSFICTPFWSNEFLFFFFFLGNLQCPFLVVFCSVTVACFSASFNVLTGILLQLKQLYFTSLVLSLLQVQCPLRNSFLFRVSLFASNHCNNTFHTYLSIDESKIQNVPVKLKMDVCVYIYI